eukprot:3941980-Rhodomonas_salina.7
MEHEPASDTTHATVESRRKVLQSCTPCWSSRSTSVRPPPVLRTSYVLTGTPYCILLPVLKSPCWYQAASVLAPSLSVRLTDYRSATPCPVLRLHMLLRGVWH